MSAFPYYKSLDGIRAVAVLMVVFLHSRLLPIGWVGVQVFFVLSGFLITSILLTQTDRPFFVFLRQFYWRRGLRIWPLYFLFLAICGTAYLLIGIPEAWPKAWPSLVTFTYNIFRISPNFPDSDYFGHFWTLCIEEQFYLIWPLAVFFLPLRLFRRCVLLVVLAGPIIRLVTGMLFAGHFDSPHFLQRAVHNMPFSHLDAFASGALLAVTPVEIWRRFAPFSLRIFAGVLLITITAGLAQSWCLWKHNLPPHWLAFGYDDLSYFHEYVWAYSLLNLSGAALIYCAIENSVVSRTLEIRPLAFVGMISYGVYVWQLPLMRVFGIIWPASDHSVSGLIRFAVYLVVTIGIATLSYYSFEKHFLKIKKRVANSSSKPLDMKGQGA